MQAISQHPHHRPIHLATAEMPATRGLASKITSFPRVLLVRSSWACTPSTLLLLGIKRFGPPLVAREAPRSEQHSIITSAWRGRGVRHAGGCSAAPAHLLLPSTCGWVG